jgi:hypothetical protein
VSYYCDAFWVALFAGLSAEGRAHSMLHPGLNDSDPERLPLGLSELEEIACSIAEGRIAPTFSAAFAEVANIEPVEWRAAPDEVYAQYRAFQEALRRISIDLHVLGLTNPVSTGVCLSELSIARQSAHWSDEIWLERNVRDRIPLLDRDSAAALLGHSADILSTNVTEFSERSERWVQLASLALLYQDGRQMEFLTHAAECLIGYGWRRDLGVMDVLDSVVELSAADPIVSRARLDVLVPIVDVITEFTDGDETNHARSELIEVVAKVATERLPSLYGHHLSADEYSYADACLVELAKLMDLESPEGAALARTFLDESPLAVLEERAQNEPAARKLLDDQYALLGSSQTVRDEKRPIKEEPPGLEKDGPEIDPASFGYKDFASVVEAASAAHHGSHGAFIAEWLHHWKRRGKASRALDSIFSYFETSESGHPARKSSIKHSS